MNTNSFFLAHVDSCLKTIRDLAKSLCFVELAQGTERQASVGRITELK